MATRKQIRANRRNSQKSTGPHTQAALKSGIDAESSIIRGESAEALQTLTDTYYERYQPAAPEEAAVLDSIIWADWLLRRYPGRNSGGHHNIGLIQTRKSRRPVGGTSP